MRKFVEPKSRNAMLRDYPIEGKLPDWYFRVEEESICNYLAEGSDIWGRKVSKRGADPDELLASIVREAADLVNPRK